MRMQLKCTHEGEHNQITKARNITILAKLWLYSESLLEPNGDTKEGQRDQAYGATKVTGTHRDKKKRPMKNTFIRAKRTPQRRRR